MAKNHRSNPNYLLARTQALWPALYMYFTASKCTTQPGLKTKNRFYSEQKIMDFILKSYPVLTIKLAMTNFANIYGISECFTPNSSLDSNTPKNQIIS